MDGEDCFEGSSHGIQTPHEKMANLMAVLCFWGRLVGMVCGVSDGLQGRFQRSCADLHAVAEIGKRLNRDRAHRQSRPHHAPLITGDLQCAPSIFATDTFALV